MPLAVSSDDGSLILVRIIDPVSLDDYAMFAGRLRSLVQDSPTPSVICTDWRRAGVLDDDIADAFIWMMRRDNPAIGRTSVLVSSAGSAQAVRMLREAGDGPRMICHSVEEVLSFLGPLCDDAMRVRVESFLAEA